MSDTFDAEPELRRPSDEHRFPCSACGSDMRFAPDEGKLICNHCGNEEEIGAEDAGPWADAGGGIEELDFESALRDQLAAADMEETRVSQCPSCGAQVEFSADTHAQECPFCATPVVTDTGTHRQIKPAALIPFKLTEREAHEAMNGWLGRLWFAPNGLRDYARKGCKMDGIYVPYWTYDADTRTRYTGMRGDAYYVTVKGADGKSRRERRIRWRPASGRVARFFDDVLVLGSRSLPKRYTDRLAPWELGALTDYRPDFLSGFRAEAYTVDLDEGMQEARQIMDSRIRQDIRRDIGGDEQRITSVDTDVSDVTFKHILLPVWLAAYKYRGKSFRFVVNGQTGKVQGERPWSWIKITLAIVLALLLAAALFFGFEYMETGQSSLLPSGGAQLGLPDK